MILLGLASALRRSELVSLTLADVELKPAGLLLSVRQSKTDPKGHGQVVAVAHGQHARTNPVAALVGWRAVRGEVPGALLTRIWGSRVSLEPLSGHVVARMLRARAEAAGLAAERVTSLRAGHATTAALAGVPLNRIAAQTRHRDLSVLVNCYIRTLEALATTSSRDRGLRHGGMARRPGTPEAGPKSKQGTCCAAWPGARLGDEQRVAREAVRAHRRLSREQ
jgi:integrase